MLTPTEQQMISNMEASIDRDDYKQAAEVLRDEVKRLRVALSQITQATKEGDGGWNWVNTQGQMALIASEALKK
jgi:Arc/MetJ-type ribon-helix-helix transcriptional regulator